MNLIDIKIILINPTNLFILIHNEINKNNYMLKKEFFKFVYTIVFEGSLNSYVD